MVDAPGDMRFASSFAAASAQDWHALVAKTLSEKQIAGLNRTTDDGVALSPIYPRAVAAPPIHGRPAGAPWRLISRIDLPEIADANRAALADLTGGAGGLELVTSGSARARGFGIQAIAAGIPALVDGVLLDLAEIRVDAGVDGFNLAEAILAAGAANGVAAAAISLAVIADPLGQWASIGHRADSFEVIAADQAGRAVSLDRAGVAGTLFEADGRPWHDAGASDGQELAGMLAQAVAYWRLMVGAGLDVDAAARRIGFTVAVDQNQFATIAKIRALRLLWARATAAAGIAARPARIHAETAWRMLTRGDPQVNMLRTTIAAFAAGVGGADSVCVLPFTQAIGLPDDFARRMARNTQSILIEEANLHRVADPAAGSGRVEAETHGLAQAAWTLFQELEAGGGLIAALRSGAWQTAIAAVATKRRQAIARRKLPLTGTSEFPNLAERAVNVLATAPEPASKPAAPAGAAAAAAEASASGLGAGNGALAAALAPRRLAEDFEALRARAARFSGASGQAPSLFLATLGGVAEFSARASWVKNLFEAGGIAAAGHDGFDSLDALIAAFKASGARAAALCSTDALYADHAAATAAALKQAGATVVYLAGRPKDAEFEAVLRASGIDGFVFAGQDAVALLQEALDRLGA